MSKAIRSSYSNTPESVQQDVSCLSAPSQVCGDNGSAVGSGYPSFVLWLEVLYLNQDLQLPLTACLCSSCFLFVLLQSQREGGPTGYAMVRVDNLKVEKNGSINTKLRNLKTKLKVDEKFWKFLETKMGQMKVKMLQRDCVVNMFSTYTRLTSDALYFIKLPSVLPDEEWSLLIS